MVKLADESPTLLIGNEGLLVRTGNYGTYCNSKLFGEETHCGSILLSDDSIYALWVVALLYNKDIFRNVRMNGRYGGGGVQMEIGGVCRPVLQILTVFETKTKIIFHSLF